MEKTDLLEQVLAEVTNVKLRNDIVLHIFKNSGIQATRIPMLEKCQITLNDEEIFARMKNITGGTAKSVTDLLGISSQAGTNWKMRGSVSAQAIIDFHLRTGISVDWLIGSWNGCGNEYHELDATKPFKSSIRASEQPVQKYLSLVEIYDQHSGNIELKWCMSKYQPCLDADNKQVPDDFGVLLSLIARYKDEAGTPDRVKNAKKRHFQVRKVLAYVLGDQKTIRQLDAKVKKHSLEFQGGIIDRSGKTEFRKHSAKYDCLKIFKVIAESYALTMVEPECNTIAWDYLIGNACVSPQDWILEKLNDFKKSSV